VGDGQHLIQPQGTQQDGHRAAGRILSGGILGNFDELKPYFKFWSSMPVRGFLAVVSVEHDRESLDVPRIPKGTDGRAIG